jgi:hypothetical protein
MKWFSSHIFVFFFIFFLSVLANVWFASSFLINLKSPDSVRSRLRASFLVMQHFFNHFCCHIVNSVSLSSEMNLQIFDNSSNNHSSSATYIYVPTCTRSGFTSWEISKRQLTALQKSLLKRKKKPQSTEATLGHIDIILSIPNTSRTRPQAFDVVMRQGLSTLQVILIRSTDSASSLMTVFKVHLQGSR